MSAKAESDDIVAAIREALESLDAMCVDEDRHGSSIRAYEVRGAVSDLRRIAAVWTRALWACDHEWLDRPESDTRECLICGTEAAG